MLRGAQRNCRAIERVQITYRDRFAGRNTPLEHSGPGVARYT